MAITNPSSLVNVSMLNYFKTKEDALVQSWDAATLNAANAYTDTEIGKVNTAATALDARVVAVETKSAANETAIGVLNGDEKTVGSVKKTVADEIAKVVADAPESFDTLKEISDWISSHSSSAAAMNTAIQQNATDISALETLVGTLPDGITATTVVAYIAEAVAAEATRATGVENGLDTRLQAVESAIGDTGSIATAIATAKSEAISSSNSYADGLNSAMDTRVSAVETLSAANKTAIDSINDASTGILKAAKDYADGLDTAMDARVTANKNAIDAINDASTGAIATAEAYTDSAIAALSTAGGAIKKVADDLSTYSTATDSRLDALEATTSAIATTDDIDSIFGA